MLEKFLKNFYGEPKPAKALLFVAAFFFFKLTVVYDFNFLYLMANELLAVHVAYFSLIWLQNNIKLSKKNILPLFNALLITMLVLLGLELLIVTITPDKLAPRFGFSQRFLMLLLSATVFVLMLYAFAILLKFYFYKQKGNPKGYYRAMLILLLIDGAMETFRPYWNNTFDLKNLFPTLFSWLENFYSILEIALLLLIVFNSFRVAWIAQLTKKEKVGLILRSFVNLALFVLSLVILYNNPTIKKIAYQFSPFIFTAASVILLFGAANTGVIFFTTIFHLPTAEVSDKRNKELSMLWSFGKLINQIFDIHELGESIISLAKQAGNTEKVWLVVDSSEGRVFLREKIEEESAREIFETLNRYGKRNVPRVVNLSENSEINFLARYNVERILSVPLLVKNEVKGFLFLARAFEEEGFDDDEIDAVIGLADYASLAIAKAELLKASIEKERMEKELEVAREIQRKIIPNKLPQSEHFDISAQFIPAFEVGGDYFDFFRFGESLAFVIADVSGKGIEASYVMAEMKGVFEALSTAGETIEELIKKANTIFSKRLEKKSFVTAVMGILRNDSVVYYRLGHNKPLIVSEGKVSQIESKGIAFGLANGELFEKSLEPKVLTLKKGETLVFYTDGVNEAMNEKSEQFGYERFYQILLEHENDSAREISLSVIKKVSVFANKNIQNDDITLLVFKKK